MPPGAAAEVAWQRLDAWLWCARFMKTRADCARLVGEGRLRINRRPTDKPHARLRVGDTVTLPLRGQVLGLQVLALAIRRGPASEARLLYREITGPGTGAEPTDTCGSGERAAYRPPEPDPA
jgi:ribosome-associated heat shock protein Hsp15